jgi:D-amino-acid dehydrogenase
MRQTDRSRSHKSAIVVGAGISGACCAAYLQQRDIEVTVIDVKGIAEETSFGNAGVLNPAGVAPVAMPGMIKQLPKWLLDPKGPLTIRWLYLPWALGWLTRFFACATHAQMERSAAALKLLAGSMFESYRGFLPPRKHLELISPSGSL